MPLIKPVILSNVFSEQDLQELRELVGSDTSRREWYDEYWQRSLKLNDRLEQHFSKMLEPLAKEVFGDETLATTYTLYVEYSHPESNLEPHHDDNACTYSIDFCLSAKTPWGVVVEGEEYMFGENQALAFMGCDQLHWRNPMPDPENNRVEMILFHFVPASHWYFTKGPDYINTIREMREKGLTPEL